MKKRKESRIVKIFKRIFNFRAMADVDRLKLFANFVVNLFKRLFIPQQNPHGGSKQSFDEAVEKLNLTKDQLEDRKKSLWRLSLLMISISVMVLIYSVYHLFWGTWPGFYLSLVVSLLALVLAFRYHFWYFQIKQRKLGCSISEWFRQGILGER